MGEPALPYAESDGTRTGGWSGTDTSHERAVRHRAKAGENQTLVLRTLRECGSYGIVVSELRKDTGWHHGTASGVLSNLDKAGKIVLLDARRGGQHIYVLAEHQFGRALAKRRRKTQSADPDVLREDVQRIIERVKEWGCTVDEAVDSIMTLMKAQS